MPGPLPSCPEEPKWTVESLKALMDERDRRYAAITDANEKALHAALTAVREATQETKHQTDKWQLSANEWRQAMTDKDRNFVTKNTLWGWLVASIMMVLALIQILERVSKG